MKFFFMIHVLLTSELLSPLVASIMAKFEQILWECFGNILKQSFKGHRNSEYTCYRHN